jgi:hypothetical protein
MISSDWIACKRHLARAGVGEAGAQVVDQRLEPRDVAFGHVHAGLVGPRDGQKLIEAQAFLLKLQLEVLDLAEHGRHLGLCRQDATLFLQV